jgi:signal transduction histidine kinase
MPLLIGMSGGTNGMPQGAPTVGPRRPPRTAAATWSDAADGILPTTPETRVTMSATKLPGPTSPPPSAASVPAAARASRLPAPPPPPSLVQEKILAEIAHELGNFFHKLYYWSDFLKDGPVRKTADATAAQMLESTIKNLEGFLKVSLDYFHPTQLAPTRMRVGDLLEGLLFQVRAHLNGTPVTVADSGGWDEAAVLIDPGQLSRALEVAVRHLTKEVGPESTIRVVVARTRQRDAEGVEVAFLIRKPNEASPLFRTAEAGVEWAVAQKVIALHGGELHEVTQARRGKTMVLFLPVAPEAIEV